MKWQFRRDFKQRPDRIAHVIRLAFHDCVGGCDGCVDEDNTDNFGPMLDTKAMFDQRYAAQWSATLSKADYYALASYVALREGVKNANVGLPQDDCIPKVFTLLMSLIIRFISLICECDSAGEMQAIARQFPREHFHRGVLILAKCSPTSQMNLA